MNALQLILLATLAALAVVYRFSPRQGAVLLKRVVLGAAAVVVVSPFLWLLAAAFKDVDVFNEYLFFPPLGKWSSETLNLDNFRELFSGKSSVQGTVYFWEYILNSVFFSTVATTVQLFFSSMGGFALAKYRFRGKNILMAFMLGSMMIPPMILLAPLYEMSVKLGWVDTYWALIVPGAVSVYGMFLFRQAMLSVPDEILDAGRMDGCGEFRIYLSLAMPLVRPMSAAFCLVAFLGSWNAYLGPNIFLHSQDNLTLPIVLNLYIAEYANQYGVFLAGTLLAIIPPAILFFALQKEFIRGLAAGAVKE